jgi:hypothetical protein
MIPLVAKLCGEHGQHAPPYNKKIEQSTYVKMVAKILEQKTIVITGIISIKW